MRLVMPGSVEDGSHWDTDLGNELYPPLSCRSLWANAPTLCVIGESQYVFVLVRPVCFQNERSGKWKNSATCRLPAKQISALVHSENYRFLYRVGPAHTLKTTIEYLTFLFKLSQGLQAKHCQFSDVGLNCFRNRSLTYKTCNSFRLLF